MSLRNAPRWKQNLTVMQARAIASTPKPLLNKAGQYAYGARALGEIFYGMESYNGNGIKDFFNPQMLGGTLSGIICLKGRSDGNRPESPKELEKFRQASFLGRQIKGLKQCFGTKHEQYNFRRLFGGTTMLVGLCYAGKACIDGADLVTPKYDASQFSSDWAEWGTITAKAIYGSATARFGHLRLTAPSNDEAIKKSAGWVPLITVSGAGFIGSSATNGKHWVKQAAAIAGVGCMATATAIDCTIGGACIKDGKITGINKRELAAMVRYYERRKNNPATQHLKNEPLLEPDSIGIKA